MLRIPVILSEALPAHDAYACLERPSEARPPEIKNFRQWNSVLFPEHVRCRDLIFDGSEQLHGQVHREWIRDHQ